MPYLCEDLFAYLDRHGIQYTIHHHRPLFTVEDGQEIKATMPGGHSKNLFLKDKNGKLVLISALGESEIRLNQLHKIIGMKRLSFGSAELLDQHLGVKPGSVSAFSLLNDPDHQVRFILDAALITHDPIYFHPLRNDMTIAISIIAFQKFLALLGREEEVIDFTALPQSVVS